MVNVLILRGEMVYGLLICVLRVVSLSEHFHVRGRPLWNLNRSFLKILFLENWY